MHVPLVVIQVSKHIVFTDRVAKELKKRAAKYQISPSKYLGRVLTSFSKETSYERVVRLLDDFRMKCDIPGEIDQRSKEIIAHLIIGNKIVAFSMLDSDLNE